MLLSFWLCASLLCVNYMKTCCLSWLFVVAAFHLPVYEPDAFHMAVCLPWLFVAWLYVTWLRLIAVCLAVSHCHSASVSLLTVAPYMLVTDQVCELAACGLGVCEPACLRVVYML